MFECPIIIIIVRISKIRLDQIRSDQITTTTRIQHNSTEKMAISTIFIPTLTLQSSSIPNPTSTKTSSSLSSSNSSFFTNTFKPLTLATHGNGSNQPKNKNIAFSCNCLFGLGVPELVVIAGVVALVFGPKKLPEVGRSIGKTVKSFQQVTHSTLHYLLLLLLFAYLILS